MWRDVLVFRCYRGAVAGLQGRMLLRAQIPRSIVQIVLCRFLRLRGVAIEAEQAEAVK